VASLAIVPGQQPVEITKRALEEARLGGYDVLLLDTAGRLHIADELMDELAQVKKLSNPIETLLVADALTGQDAVNVARAFNERIGVTGIVLTRLDGDARGGAALSMRAVTGRPIKFAGVGEKLAEFEEFHPQRIAARILDRGDVVSLVEKAAEAVSQEQAEKMAAKMQAGQFDLNDLAEQLKNIRKMGGLGGLMGMLPGIGKLKGQLQDAQLDDKVVKRQEAIISSMTAAERRDPRILNGSRRRRIAAGSGTTVQDVNRVLKMHLEMGTMMKKMKKLGPKNLMRGGLGGLLGGMR
jgi:signal recognition particle subunit SRP54